MILITFVILLLVLCDSSSIFNDYNSDDKNNNIYHD